MLWSDPDDEPTREVHETQAMLRRAGLVVAIAMILAMFVLGLH